MKKLPAQIFKNIFTVLVPGEAHVQRDRLEWNKKKTLFGEKVKHKNSKAAPKKTRNHLGNEDWEWDIETETLRDEDNKPAGDKIRRAQLGGNTQVYSMNQSGR